MGIKFLHKTPRPELCNIPYMKPLDEVIQSFGIKCHQYAGSVQLYCSLPSNSKKVAESFDQTKIKSRQDRVSVRALEVSILDGVAFSLKKQTQSLEVYLLSNCLQPPRLFW